MRAPGFPAAGVLSLGAPNTTRAIDLLAVESEVVDAARAAAIAVLERAGASKPINRTLKALKRGEVPTNVENLSPDVVACLEALARAEAVRAQAQHGAEQALAAESRSVAAFLNDVAGEPRFREALLWQNRAAVHGSVMSLSRRPLEASDSKTREQRRLVASVVQRYCVKNDTIGFFGPVGWARLSGATEPVRVEPGVSLLTKRTVYFEYWCIDALAQKLAQDPELRPYCKPRRTPSVWLEGTLLHHPNGQRIELPVPFARLLARLDGEQTARQIAQELLADTSLGLEDEQEVFDLLAELEKRKLCTWSFEIPPATFHPERHLRDLLTRAEAGPRDRGLAALASLDDRRTAVAAAAGDPDRLDQAMQALETTFEELTQATATRKGGETYAGRTLVFEDCRRDLDVEIGARIVESVAPALGLVLDSARWYTHAIATRYEAGFRRIYDELQDARGETAVPYVEFRDRLKPLFPGPQADHGIAHDVARALQISWEAILGIGDATGKVIRRTSTELRPAVAAAFDAPGPGWPSARHHSPDILIAAQSLEAIRRGEFHIVLGELHVGFNTVTLPCLLKEHPDPSVLVRAREADLPGPGVAPVWSKARNRADFFSMSGHDFDVETAETRSARPRDHVLAAGALVVDAIADQLVVRARRRGPTFDLTAFLEQHLIAESFSQFHLLGRRGYIPRIMVDNVIIQRESWQLSAHAVPFADAKTEHGRFLAARRFAAQRGMPRMVYAKTDTEAKPFFIDFESPILIEILARQLKRASRVVLSEMSPTLTECWLPDARDQRYTCELRLAATDARAWTPAHRVSHLDSPP